MTHALIYRLRREHARLNAAVAAAARKPAADPIQLSELKRRKLALKDRIAALEAWRQPQAA